MSNIQNKFTEFYYKYKVIIITLIVGILIGVTGTSVVFIKSRPNIPKVKPSATVENKSGAPLRVAKIKSDRNNVTIDTIYDGAGESQIKIPTPAIPSAYAWENYRLSACGGYMTNKTFMAGLGYRYERLTVMGGGFVRVGVQAEAGLWGMASWSFKPWWE